MTNVVLFWVAVVAAIICTTMASPANPSTPSLLSAFPQFRGGAIGYRLKRRPQKDSTTPSSTTTTASTTDAAAKTTTTAVDDQTPSIPDSPTTTTPKEPKIIPTPKNKKAAVAEARNAMEENKMPSVFTTTNEQQYDRYAACLAATEGLRKARDLAIQKTPSGKNGGKSVLGGQKKGSTYGIDTLEYKRAQAQYLLQSTKVIRALGLTVSQFNQMGREIGNDESLKEKVMEQAFLYRMAATVDLKKVPLIEFPQSEKLLKAQRKSRVQMFAQSMTDIEELRTEQIERLKKALHVDQLPEGVNICDPAIRPILNPKVRAVVEAFPLQAETIVRKYGLNSDEFNHMLEETKSNPILRWRVKSYMGKSGGGKGKGKEKK
eukprot:CAMPEP_0185728546 /NCGR_PEP_ID=MMETSP1171-20130828/3842_1 /TAXON_ID=374046 /ORGANISM="Helicotheca tamensis, Strain CCMP826" /LENGTH=375 /DNA_ID=CAMNT_0028397267 /DNA_START=174 /DNA_END=1301 /DNA_ORIENTATION=+